MVSTMINDEELNKLDEKSQKIVKRLLDRIKELEEENLQFSMDKLRITSDITFMAVGMRFRGNHRFSAKDIISLEKEDDNPKDNTAIKVLVDGVHVGYVSREYTNIIRCVNDFEKKSIVWLQNFPQSAKLKLIH